MNAAIEHIRSVAPHAEIALSAQSHLRGMYEGFGFAAVSPEYLEDGIPHIDMTLKSFEGLT